MKFNHNYIYQRKNKLFRSKHGKKSSCLRQQMQNFHNTFFFIKTFTGHYFCTKSLNKTFFLNEETEVNFKFLPELLSFVLTTTNLQVTQGSYRLPSNRNFVYHDRLLTSNIKYIFIKNVLPFIST